MSYDNKNRGAIWPNKNKEKDTHADFTGHFTDEHGVEYWVSAWRKKEDANPKAPSLSFSMKRKDAVHGEGVQQARQAVEATPPPDDDLEDSIPF